MQASERQYTGVLQFFHNYEHDPDGRTHCIGMPSNPYVIQHKDGKHIISTEFAKGHGYRCVPQWFKFTKREGWGYDMSSAEKVDESEVTQNGKANKSKGANDLWEYSRKHKDHRD